MRVPIITGFFDRLPALRAERANRGARRAPKGRGLNSIPIRFAVMTGALTSLCVAAQLYLWVGMERDHVAISLVIVVLACSIIIPTLITWAAATKLTGQIDALKKSTEAIVNGDFDAPVDVDCACEVGGLAESFRKMVGRLNSNILRMNVLAYSDPLTGLPNRAVATHMLGHLMSANREGSVIFIDLDGFKKINDNLGHEAGDELLRQASLRIIEIGLERTVEDLDACTTPFGELCDRAPEDVVFVRFAGDEFVAILPGLTSRSELETISDRVVAALKQPFLIKGSSITIGASVGIARAPVDSQEALELLNFADLAMYVAKQAGKNGYRFFDPEMRNVVVERNRIESDLRQAIAQNQLVLHYQPKLDARSLECTGVEALVRWNHPDRGVLGPGDFIQVAEQAGLMREMGYNILRMAIVQCRAWLDAGTPRKIAVNISPAQFEDNCLAEGILALLFEFDVDASMLELEITESMLVSDFAMTKTRLLELQQAGVEISIDDFGVGFSNLSQLARLPFNALKIDRSLVADIGANPKSEGIVRAIVGMAQALGHRTIAEGIEHPEQLQFLSSIGCDQVQGFLFSKPVAAAAIDEWEKDRQQNRVADLQAKLVRHFTSHRSA